MGYNLKRDGWLNSFSDVKNQSMSDDEVHRRGAREKCPKFFSIIFSVLTDNDNIILDWQCDVGSFLTSLFLMSLFSDVLISFVFGLFSIHFFILYLCFAFVVLRGSFVLFLFKFLISLYVELPCTFCKPHSTRYSSYVRV